MKRRNTEELLTNAKKIEEVSMSVIMRMRMIVHVEQHVYVDGKYFKIFLIEGACQG